MTPITQGVIIHVDGIAEESEVLNEGEHVIVSTLEREGEQNAGRATVEPQ